jgi:hypothetical protein
VGGTPPSLGGGRHIREAMTDNEGTDVLQGVRVSLGIGHVGTASFAEGRERETPPKARVVAEGHNHLAGEEAPEPAKKALLLEFEEPLDHESLHWRFAVATIRYAEEPFERLAAGKPITSYIRYVPASAVESPDPFVDSWSEGTPFLIATLHMSDD